MVDDPDTELVVRVAAGEREAARALIERHLPMILGLARRMLASPDEAEDVAQETFSRVWTHAGRWRPGAARFKTWVHRVAMNLCYDRLRGRQHLDLSAADHVRTPEPGPAAVMYRQQVSGHVDAALAKLPQRQKEAILLVHLNGLSNIDAAELMSVSVEALESLLARGRRNLRALLTPVAAGLTGA
jgi:RNA polymerase sigma-70 factor (ECF subfamily)